jgi:hypothetical protein
MSAHALLSVVLQKLPVRKTSKAGKPYLMASARDGKGPDAKWWTVFAFNEAAIEALEVLAEGETFAASGTFDATIWAPEGREPRVNLTLTADAILSARKPSKAKPEGATRKPQAAKGRRDRAEATPSAAEPRPGRDIASKSWAAPARAEVETHRGSAPVMDDGIPFFPEWR